jgi:hypothetical protein
MSSSYEPEILRDSDSLEEWDQFVDQSPQGCIFCRSWWLEAVCPNGFDILTVRSGGRIVAGMPLPRSCAWGRRVIEMPVHTQTLGALIAPSGRSTYERRLSHEMSILGRLVEAIPEFDRFSMNFHYNFTNWLPFYWADYEQTTRYTYVLTDLTDLDSVFSSFAHMKRKNIKKAQRLVQVHEDLPADEFYAYHEMTLRKKRTLIRYGFESFKRICEAAYGRNAGKTWYAVGSKGNVHAAILVIFDSKSAYYLISAIDPDQSHSGAATLLLKHAISYASRHTRRFDLEGSMDRGVEQSFRKLGAVQTPYFNISRDKRPAFLKGSTAARRAGGRMLRRLGIRR